MHLASIAYLEKNHGIWDMIDGIVISSRICTVMCMAPAYQTDQKKRPRPGPLGSPGGTRDFPPNA